MLIKTFGSQRRYLVFLVLGVITVTLLFNTFMVPQTMARSSLTREQIKAMVIRQAQGWENQDAAAIAEDFAEDALFVAAGFEFQGKQKIEQAARDYFKQAHQTTVEIKNIIIDGNKGAVEWDWRDRNRKTGKRGFAEDAIVFELANGKIVYWREYIEKKEPT